MKAWWPKIKLILVVFLVWRLILFLIENIAPRLFLPGHDFLGPIAWANFDGLHYLSIAKEGYRQYLEAFFPLYPLLIGWMNQLIPLRPEIVAVVISHVSTILGLIFFSKLSQKYDQKNSLWPTIFLLLFPTSFFLATVYAEGLYFFLVAASLWAIERRRWWWAGILGGLASATKLFGLYLLIAALWEYFSQARRKANQIIAIGLIPLGLVFYMAYLGTKVGDPLAFFHVQPAFGANRSGGELILPPQVIWRYLMIFLTTPAGTLLYKVALFEFVSFLFAIFLLWKAWRWKLKFSLILYSAAVIITPALTGTLSSFPRYLLSAFPLFLVMGKFSPATKMLLIIIFVLALVYFASAFLLGYFVA